MRVFILLLTFMCFSPFLNAAEVIKVKGKAALINLNGDPAVVGDTFFTISADGKRRGIIRISKVKGDKAIARISKGKVSRGMSLELRGGGSSGSSGGYTSRGSSGDTGSFSGRKAYWGILGGLAMDKMSVSVKNSTTHADFGTASMSGTAFSLKGLFDYQLFPQLWFRGSSGIEGFNAGGNAICGVGNNSACTANIYYLSADFIARYLFSEKKIRPYAGAGIELLFPASKNASALEASSIATTNVIVVQGGVDWFISNTSYVPLSLEYGLLPKSDEVTASWIAFRVGYAFPF
jgi:hypothetical protein